jgi:YlmC/YmxH family sporulation protein
MLYRKRRSAMDGSMELRKIEERRGTHMLFSELKCREVINVCTGERYGTVCDLVFDPCSGEVQAIVVPGGTRFFGLLKGKEGMPIPFSKIRKLGEDVILVELP